MLSDLMLTHCAVRSNQPKSQWLCYCRLCEVSVVLYNQ